MQIRSGGEPSGAAKVDESGAKPTAIVCGNDIIAMGALLEAQALGIRVPEDLSIVGFDDVAMASHIHPALTTMQVPSREMGTKAADYLLSRLNEDPVADHLELEAKLVVRETTAGVSH